MSDTPRTDEKADFWRDAGRELVNADFARELELELAQVRAYNTELVALNDHRVFARERAEWEERYKSLDSARYHLGIKLNVAQADAAAVRKELAEVTAAFQAACPHEEWEKVDDSFSHEFGTEIIRYCRCEKCGKIAEPDDVEWPEADDEPRIDQRELRDFP